jgi:hypothetical protein
VKSSENSLKMGDRMVETIKKLEDWNGNKFEEEV